MPLLLEKESDMGKDRYMQSSEVNTFREKR